MVELGVNCAIPRRPYISKADREDEATTFLRTFYPLALDSTIAVPIVQIATDMGITMIVHRHLTEDFSVYGQMCFSDGKVDIYNDLDDEYESMDVAKGTMLIDPHTKLTCNVGCFNNTVAHETFHWYRHRDYFEALSAIDGQSIYATRCNRDQIEGKARGQLKTDIDWIEWQATSIAPRILMPQQTFEWAARKFISDNERYYRTAKSLCYNTIGELAERFHVSRTSAGIRFEELGLVRLLR